MQTNAPAGAILRLPTIRAPCEPWQRLTRKTSLGSGDWCKIEEFRRRSRWARTASSGCGCSFNMRLRAPSYPKRSSSQHTTLEGEFSLKVFNGLHRLIIGIANMRDLPNGYRRE
jgi:hypothetical protein